MDGPCIRLYFRGLIYEIRTKSMRWSMFTMKPLAIQRLNLGTFVTKIPTTMVCLTGKTRWKSEREPFRNWIGGFNMDLTYKNFDLTAFFQGAWGFNQRVALKWGVNFSELMYNERWTPENNHSDGLIPRLGGAGSNEWGSDFYYKKSDYLRLKTMSLGYNLPRSILQKVNIQNLRLYFAGTNVFTLSGMNKYSIDPEAPNGQGGYYYPQMRTFSFGINLTL